MRQSKQKLHLKQKIEKHLQQQIPLENFAWLAHIKALVASQ